MIAAQEVRGIDCSTTCATRRAAALHSILAAILESPAGSSLRIAPMTSSMTCTPFSSTRPSRLLLSSLIMVGARRRSARQAIFKSQSNTGFPYGVSPSTPHRIEPLHVYTFVRESRRDKTSCHPTVRINKKLKGAARHFHRPSWPSCSKDPSSYRYSTSPSCCSLKLKTWNDMDASTRHLSSTFASTATSLGTITRGALCIQNDMY